MAADIGKVYPTEVHLLKKELEVQGDLLSQERKARQEEIDSLREQLKTMKGSAEVGSENQFRYEPGFIVGKWSPWVRALSSLSGIALIRFALRRRGALGLIASSVGLALVSRAITNRDITQLIGTAILPVLRMRRSLFIAASIETVYDFLKDFSNYPKFMSYIYNVTVDDTGTLTWTAKAPGGTRIHWQTTVQALQQNERIAWKSIPGSLIATEGIIQLRATDIGTQVFIELSYAPPAGALGYAFAHILGFDPRSRIDDDLKILADLFEQKAPADHPAAAPSHVRVP